MQRFILVIYVMSNVFLHSLTNKENLFTNKDRALEPWTVYNAKDSDQTCTPPNSITRKKCDVPRRAKRSLSRRHVGVQERPYYSKFAELRAKVSYVSNRAIIVK